MKIPQPLDGLGAEERTIAVDNYNEVVGGQRFPRGHQGVSRSALLFLQHELDAGSSDSIANPSGFVSDDGVDVACRDHFGCGGNHVSQQRVAPGPVPTFWM